MDKLLDFEKKIEKNSGLLFQIFWITKNSNIQIPSISKKINSVLSSNILMQKII